MRRESNFRRAKNILRLSCLCLLCSCLVVDPLPQEREKLSDAPPPKLTLREIACENSRNSEQQTQIADEEQLKPRQIVYTAEAFADIRVFGGPLGILSIYDTKDPIEIGRTTTYVIELRNEGSSPLTHARITFSVDDAFRIASVRSSTDYYFDNELTIVFEPFPILYPGEKLLYYVTCLAIRAGSTENRALACYAQLLRKDIFDEETTSVSIKFLEKR